MPLNIESGLKNIRPEFVAEATTGVAPANPAWNGYSETVFQAGPWVGRADVFPLLGVGSVDPLQFFLGPEDHALTMEYYLAQAISADALNDAVPRDADNNLANSHTVVIREERTLSVGIASSGTRIYTVGLGGFVGEIIIPGQVDTGEPVRPRLSYVFEKVRGYRIDQPSATTLIGANGTNAGDTTQTVLVESLDATVTQSVALAGLTEVSLGVTTYPDIDSISLDLETIGDVEIWINTGTDAAPVKGSILSTIRGDAAYDGVEGDLGIPPLGTGAHDASLPAAYEQFLDDTVERPGGTDLAFSVNSIELRINNNLGVITQGGTRRKKVVPGERTTELRADVWGEFESHLKMDEHLRGIETNIVWTMTGSTLTINGAIMSEPGDRSYARDVPMMLNTVFIGKGITIT